MNNLNESQTRKQLIDPMLIAAGWNIVSYDKTKELIDYNTCAIEEYPTEFGPADYALCVDGQIIGVVEAKKLTLVPTEAELARQEGRDYEPADVLLERIKAEQGKSEKKVKQLK